MACLDNLRPQFKFWTTLDGWWHLHSYFYITIYANYVPLSFCCEVLIALVENLSHGFSGTCLIGPTRWMTLLVLWWFRSSNLWDHLYSYFYITMHPSYLPLLTFCCEIFFFIRRGKTWPDLLNPTLPDPNLTRLTRPAIYESKFWPIFKRAGLGLTCINRRESRDSERGGLGNASQLNACVRERAEREILEPKNKMRSPAAFINEWKRDKKRNYYADDGPKAKWS